MNSLSRAISSGRVVISFAAACLQLPLLSSCSGTSGTTAADEVDVRTQALSADANASNDKGVGESAANAALAAEGPLGFWKFDDCSPTSRELVDSSGQGLNASWLGAATCLAGVDSSAIGFAGNHVAVQVPGVAQVAFVRHVGVAAWIWSEMANQPQTIVEHAGTGQGSFALGIFKQRLEFSVLLEHGGLVSVSAPLQTKRWTHVAGLFDGEFITIFVDGQKFAQVSARGQLRAPRAALRFGRSASGHALRGRIDEVRVWNTPVDASLLTAGACVARPTGLSVSPTTSGAVPAATAVLYETRVENRDFGQACTLASYRLAVGALPAGFVVEQDSSSISLLPGQSGVLATRLTGTLDAEPGVSAVPFSVLKSGPSTEQLSRAFNYELTEPLGCHVTPARELLLRRLSVVEDPIRTAFNAPGDAREGAWTFARVMQNLAPSPEQAPAMVEALFDTWLHDQTVNGLTLPARPTLRELVLANWPRKAGALDLERAPVRLLAIVNRMDLRNLAAGNAGEGRFVFGVTAANASLPFTLIVEFKLPAQTEADVLAWADAWHALGRLPVPSESYNAALQRITERFAGRNAAPGRVNGSALGQLRSNEIALGKLWELREFTLSAATGFFEPTTVKLTPDTVFNQTPLLAAFVNANEAAILAERHSVPETFAGAPFLTGASSNDFVPWSAAGINNNAARHKFALNTCNGCHGPETNTRFLHILPRALGKESGISPFLNGTSAVDIGSGEVRRLNDIGRRRLDLMGLVCPTALAASSDLSSSRTPPPSAATLSEHVRRVGRQTH